MVASAAAQLKTDPLGSTMNGTQLRLIVLCIALPACATTAQAQYEHPTGTDSLVGCYQLRLTGPWRVPPGSGDPTGYAAPPAVFQLFTASADSAMHHQIALPGLRARFPGQWHRVGLDSLIISWSHGFGGVIVSLGWRDSLFIGVAHSSTDVSPRPEPEAPVEVRQVRCAR